MTDVPDAEPPVKARARPDRHKRSATGVRLPIELANRLAAAAEERDVSINWLVNRAVEHFLDRLIPVDEIKWTRDP